MRSKIYPLFLIFLVVTLLMITAVASLALNPSSKASLKNKLANDDWSLTLTTLATGFDEPVSLAHSGDERLFVVERDGIIKIIHPDNSVTTFLNIEARVDPFQSEEGLLGLVFHPDYSANGYFYVNYTNSDTGRETRISRFSVSGNPDVADAGSEDILLKVEQPNWNHNAGDIHFSPNDGYLYIPLGDGGGGGDILNNAQNLNLALGKILRIDVDEAGASPNECNNIGGSGNYGIVPSNPFTATDGICDLIWAIGLRNPWRSSFDRLTGDLYLGDVGQGSWEEVSYQPADSTGEENYGWRCYEGDHAYNTSGCGAMADYEFPIFEYPNPSDSCASVIGGYVYRGTRYPSLYGRYLLADYCSGTFWDLDTNNSFQVTEHTHLQQFGFVAFGEDVDGELYLANRSNGRIYQLHANNKPIAADDEYITAENSPLTVANPGVLENDLDKDLHELTAVLNTPPEHGTLTLHTDGGFIYTPTLNYFGTDSFTYFANDGLDNANEATIIITVTNVNNLPTASNDVYTASVYHPLHIPAPGLLENDSDADDDPIEINSYGNTALGALTVWENGRFAYTPTVMITSTDSFTYTLTDGLTTSNIATVTLQLVLNNIPPLAFADSYQVAPNKVLTVTEPGVLENDSDANGDSLTAVLQSSTSNGNLDLQENGQFVYTPTLDFVGIDQFSYIASDGIETSTITTVTIHVTYPYHSYLPYIRH